MELPADGLSEGHVHVDLGEHAYPGHAGYHREAHCESRRLIVGRSSSYLGHPLSMARSGKEGFDIGYTTVARFEGKEDAEGRNTGEALWGS